VHPSPPDPAERAAETEARFRHANDRLRETYRAFGEEDGALPFICECADPRCTRVAMVPIREYDELRTHPSRFVVLRGHARGDLERVVADHERFQIVEKAGRLAETGDRR
jgi:hypothetical protein